MREGVYLCALLLYGRSLGVWCARYRQEAGAALELLAEALRRGVAPGRYVQRALRDRLLSELARREREAAVGEAYAGEGGALPDPLLREQILSALSALSPDSRQAALLLAEGGTAGDVARALGISAEAARSRVLWLRRHFSFLRG